MITFSADAYQNEYLPIGGTEVNAVVTITGEASGGAISALGPAVEVIVIDVSGSMQADRKIQAAKAATAQAIDCIRDGVQFAIVAGHSWAESVYPDLGLTVSSDITRAIAKTEVAKLKASGGTAMGSWLTYVDTLFSAVPDARKHAILLTDGRNERESPADLAHVLDHCEGRFQCDCRGVGADWEVSELRSIASRLLGSVDIIVDPQRMSDDFCALMQSAIDKAVHDVALSLWTPHGAAISFVKQVAPTLEDLTPLATAIDERTTQLPLGAWGTESRDYHVSIQVPARDVGDEMLAARLSVLLDGKSAAGARLRAVWTDDVALSTRLNREVAHYTGQIELAEAIQNGLAARHDGDDATARLKLGRAAQLAAAAHDNATLEQLAKVVDIDDASTGSVQLKQRVDAIDEKVLDMNSTKTRPVRRSPA